MISGIVNNLCKSPFYISDLQISAMHVLIKTQKREEREGKTISLFTDN